MKIISMSKQKNVFSVEYRFDHELMFDPIAKEFGKNYDFNMHRLRLTSIYSILNKTNIKIKKIAVKNTDDNFNYKRNRSGKIRSKLLGMFCGLIFSILYLIPTFKHKKPDIIIVVNDLTFFGRAAIVAGHIMKISSVRISASVVAPNQRTPPLYADFMVVSGEAIKKVYVQSGIPEEKIIITGNPRFDTLFKRNRIEDRNKIFAKYKLDPNKKLIVFTSQPIQEREKLLNAVFNTLKKLPEMQLIVKLHPSESALLYYQIMDMIKLNNAIIVEDIEIYELLNAADCVLTSFSATGLEAMMLDKPVISINLTGELDRMPYAESGAALGVYHEDELAPAIMRALINDAVREKLKVSREKFVERYNYKMDGQAAKRVIDLFDEII